MIVRTCAAYASTKNSRNVAKAPKATISCKLHLSTFALSKVSDEIFISQSSQRIPSGYPSTIP